MPIPCQIDRYIQILWDTFVHPETSCVQLHGNYIPWIEDSPDQMDRFSSGLPVHRLPVPCRDIRR